MIPGSVVIYAYSGVNVSDKYSGKTEFEAHVEVEVLVLSFKIKCNLFKTPSLFWT